MRRYFYSLDDTTRVGPVTLELLRAKVVAGELRPEHFVFVEGSGAWTEARLVDDLFPSDGALASRSPSGPVAGAAPASPPAVPSPPAAPRARPAGLRPIRTSDYASTPPVRGMPVARGLYGPPEPCPMRYRAAATVVDGAIAGLLLAIVIPTARALAHAMATPGASDARAMWLATVLGLTIAPWLYHAGLDCAPWRGTLGKAMFDIRVVDATGGRLTFRRASARHFAKLLSALPLGAGFVWAWFDPSLRTWHDRLTRTAVQRTPPV